MSKPKINERLVRQKSEEMLRAFRKSAKECTDDLKSGELSSSMEELTIDQRLEDNRAIATLEELKRRLGFLHRTLSK